MRTINLGVLAAFVLSLASVALFGYLHAQVKKTDEERIVGSWTLVKGQENGKEMPAELFGALRLIFSKDGKFAVEIAGLGKDTPDARYKLVNPGQIDLGPEKETSLGIYRFDTDDRLTICFTDSKGGNRPTEFATKEASKHMLFVLERAKSEDKMTPEEKAKAKAAVDIAIQRVRDAASRTVNANNLKQIAMAIQLHHDVTKSLPLHAIYDKDGKTPLLSWRVTILPYIEQDSLYKQFKLDEPWDSEHNKKLISQMPRLYASPGDAKINDGMTRYQVFTGPDTVFDGAKKMTFNQITNGDGASNTILAIDSADPVIWTKPQDLVLPKEKGKFAAMGNVFNDRIAVSFCDTSVRTIRGDLTTEILRALVTPNGKEIIDWNLIDN